MQTVIKRSFYLAAVVLILALQAQAQQLTSEGAKLPPAPHLYAPFTSFDFGDVYKGEIISHIFVIKNEGTADLVIKDFAGGCGCEVVSADTVISPGKEGKATIEINTAAQFGQISKPATLRTNDPERPNIVLTLIANVLTSADGGPVKGVAIRQGKHIGPIFLGPDVRGVFNIVAGQKTKMEFTISVEKGPLKVLRVESNGKYFTARLETVKEGKNYKIIVEPITTETAGTYEETLQVVTDSRVLPAIPIHLFLQVRPKQ
ncbi:MAG TPA: DUF1573 domain-containing protein [Blastocatellia bacterium]|nr:DUF1573 domain-containing protein [Blastocatellia bacterium]